MPRVRQDPAGVVSEGDQRWLGSTRGIYTNRNVVLDPADFAAYITDGYIPSGTPLTAPAGSAEATPYTGAAGQVLEGFLFTDQTVLGLAEGELINGPLTDWGRIRTEFLPVPEGGTAFVIPPEGERGQFTFITGYPEGEAP